MLTVKEHLLKMDKGDLTDKVMNISMTNLAPYITYSKDNFEEMCKKYSEKITSFINMLTETTPSVTTPDKPSYILFAYETYAGICVDVCKYDDKKIYSDKVFPEYENWKESLNWIVADTPFTNSNILYVIAQYLISASAFGFNEEEKQKRYEIISRFLNTELEKEIFYPAEEVFEELEGKYGFLTDNKYQNIKNKIDGMIEKYDNAHRLAEINKLSENYHGKCGGEGK